MISATRIPAAFERDVATMMSASRNLIHRCATRVHRRRNASSPPAQGAVQSGINAVQHGLITVHNALLFVCFASSWLKHSSWFQMRKPVKRAKVILNRYRRGPSASAKRLSKSYVNPTCPRQAGLSINSVRFEYVTETGTLTLLPTGASVSFAWNNPMLPF